MQETYEVDVTVSLVARRHGVAPNQLFRWRKLASQGALVATQAQEEVVAASEYRALQAQIRELHRLLGKKTPAFILVSFANGRRDDDAKASTGSTGIDACPVRAGGRPR